MAKFRDLSGQTFGHLTVITHGEPGPRNRRRWLCRCVCGKEITVYAQHLLAGRATTCGCTRRDLSSRRFGRWSVLSPAEPGSNGRAQWLCRCDCGNERVVLAQHLTNGRSQSCGCWQREKLVERLTVHGETVGGKSTREFRIWSHMLNRCNNPKDENYRHYGGRGIQVCERWRTFENFLADMGRAADDLTLDRINNSGDYSPENCRWATWEEQNTNKRNTLFVEHNGERIKLYDLAKREGVTYGFMYYRKILARPRRAHKDIS